MSVSREVEVIRAESAESTRAREAAHKRRQAEARINQFAGIAVVVVLFVSWIPGAATGALCLMEGTMLHQVRRIVKGTDWATEDLRASASAIGLAAVVGPIIAMEATILLGPLAFVAKPAVAAFIVKAMGQSAIKHFEEDVPQVHDDLRDGRAE